MREYVEQLIEQGSFRIVEREVDPRFELAAVTVRSQAESEAPLLFRKVKGSRLPVVTNLFGSRSRLCELIGAADGNFCRRWQELLGAREPLRDTPARAPEHRERRLCDLPQVAYFEKDAGSYITAGIFLAKEPDSGVPNLSFHRAMTVSDTELRVKLGRTHDLAKYQAKAEARGQALEAAILLGPAPQYVLAAVAPLAYEESELDTAHRVAGRRMPMRRCRHIDLEVPADTEIVIEGRFLPGLRRPEAPFGEFQGYYVPQVESHVFEVLGVTAREGAYYHALVCGAPEDLRLLEIGGATQIYRELTQKLPGIIDVACAPHVMSTVVKIEQQYEGHARQVLLSAIGVNHDWSKSCIVVDEDVDIKNFDDVWWAFLTRARPDERVMVIPGVPGFWRDPMKDHWGRLAIDATVPFERREQYLRKKIPGVDTLVLADYLSGRK
ncbi:MAG: decarboxylase [Betaproteobacteria bacterium RIFCSPLOWO2_02_FULL_65_24]|nr:MAG: decarboxylase [Betaproteobacteria bacterium RIFCSPLOWO2_02_FULL_65_24]